VKARVTPVRSVAMLGVEIPKSRYARGSPETCKPICSGRSLLQKE